MSMKELALVVHMVPSRGKPLECENGQDCIRGSWDIHTECDYNQGHNGKAKEPYGY